MATNYPQPTPIAASRNLTGLPDELIKRVLSYLAYTDTKQFTLTCRRLYNVVSWNDLMVLGLEAYFETQNRQFAAKLEAQLKDHVEAQNRWFEARLEANERQLEANERQLEALEASMNGLRT